MSKSDHSKLIDDLVSDIKYLEDLGLGADEIWDNLERDYRSQATENDLAEAFSKCGYTVTF